MHREDHPSIKEYLGIIINQEKSNRKKEQMYYHNNLKKDYKGLKQDKMDILTTETLGSQSQLLISTPTSSLETLNSAQQPSGLEQAMIDRAIEISQGEQIRKCFSKNNELKVKYRKMIPNLRLKSTSQICTICQENFVVDEIIKKLPCKHIMHRECAKQWLRVNKSCTVCRLDLEQYYREKVQNQTQQAPSGKQKKPIIQQCKVK